MKYIPIIIILVLILAIIISIYCGIRYLKRKAMELSMTLFRTTNITKSAEQLRQEYASTPKSVSGMTSLLLPKLAADFPEFQYNEMKERAENVLTSYLRAISKKETSLLTEGNSELKQQLEHHIQQLADRNARETFDQIKLHRTELNQYRKAAGKCIVTFQTALECYHYITNTSDSTVTEGSKDYKYQTKYNVDVIYIQDRDLMENKMESGIGVNCPNCGAPLPSLGAKTCEYCGSPVIEINIHAWAFSNVEEVR